MSNVVMADSTLAFAESAFTTVMSLSELPMDSEFFFRIVSEIKLGWELWTTEEAQVTTNSTENKRTLLIFRENEKSKALRARKNKKEDRVVPFLFFCAYIPSKKVLQVVKIKGKSIFTDITSFYRKDPDIYNHATCVIKKMQMNNMPSYSFDLVKTLGSDCAYQIVKSPLPKECVDLMETMPFYLDNVYLNEDPFMESNA